MVLLPPNIGHISWYDIPLNQVISINLNSNSSNFNSKKPTKRMMFHKHRCH